MPDFEPPSCPTCENPTELVDKVQFGDQSEMLVYSCGRSPFDGDGNHLYFQFIDAWTTYSSPLRCLSEAKAREP